MSPQRLSDFSRWLLVTGLVLFVLGSLGRAYVAGVAADGDAWRADVAECLQRCEPHPVDEHTTKPDGSLGCICDETRTVR